MPYFKGPDCHFLHIHIPKTGGTSVNYYLSKKYGIPLNENSLYTDDIVTKKFFFKNMSRQHLSFETLYENKDIFKIDWTDPSLQLLAVVRNPYERIISDMKWWGMITERSDKDHVYNLLQNYIKLDNIDVENIKVFHTENLNEELDHFGFKNFNTRLQTTKNSKINNLLSIDSIELINNFYKNDFLYFGYEML
jgi:hypothetical protein